MLMIVRSQSSVIVLQYDTVPIKPHDKIKVVHSRHLAR